MKFVLLIGLVWLLVSLLCIVCSALSKEQGITVAAVCIVYDFFIVHKVWGRGERLESLK